MLLLLLMLELLKLEQHRVRYHGSRVHRVCVCLKWNSALAPISN